MKKLIIKNDEFIVIQSICEIFDLDAEVIINFNLQTEGIITEETTTMVCSKDTQTKITQLISPNNPFEKLFYAYTYQYLKYVEKHNGSLNNDILTLKKLRDLHGSLLPEWLIFPKELSLPLCKVNSEDIKILNATIEGLSQIKYSKRYHEYWFKFTIAFLKTFYNELIKVEPIHEQYEQNLFKPFLSKYMIHEIFGIQRTLTELTWNDFHKNESDYIHIQNAKRILLSIYSHHVESFF